MATRSSKTTTKTTTRKTSTTASKAKSTTTKSTAKPKTSVTAAAKKATTAVKAPPAPAAAPTPVVSAPQPVVSGPILRKKELVDQVVKMSGVKKKDAKPVVEAMLKVLGAALQDGRELNLQPFGKVRINRERKRPEGKVMIARIRQTKDLPASDVPAPQAKDVLPDEKATAAE